MIMPPDTAETWLDVANIQPVRGHHYGLGPMPPHSPLELKQLPNAEECRDVRSICNQCESTEELIEYARSEADKYLLPW